MKHLRQFIFPFLLIGVGMGLLVVSRFVRTPMLVAIRPWDVYVSMTLCLVVLGYEFLLFTGKNTRKILLVHLAILLLFPAALLIVGTKEVHFQEVKRKVLEAPRIDDVWAMGQHFIVGYRTYDEIATLVDAGGVGGIFVSQRNVADKTRNQVKDELASLQKIQKNHNRPPLLIATDQEGGIVSRLTPPLPYHPSLASVIHEANPIEVQRAIDVYAASQAAELTSIGINVNFAPVADLNFGIVDSDDKYSKIYDRAIASDSASVTDAVMRYSQTLLDNGVLPTLKHFPGLGRVHGDSHLTRVVLDTEKEELLTHDWVPFYMTLFASDALVMVGHVEASRIDPGVPASISKVLITDILRTQLHLNNVVVTDDFSMAPIYESPQGVSGATVQSLNAGADLILFAYDTDLYYDAMNATLAAYKSGSLDKIFFEESNRRLEKARQVLTTFTP